MFNFQFVCDNGSVCAVRARSRSVAIRLYCEAEGCDRAFVKAHCVVRKDKNGDVC